MASSFTYTLNAVGNRTQLVANNGTTTFGYDNLHRLTSATYPGPTMDTYTYDANGNRTAKNSTTYTYNDGDHMTAVGATSYGYDNNGNQTSRGSDTFTLDHENRMTQSVVGGVTSSSVYYGDGVRKSHTVNGVTTNYKYDVLAGLPVVVQDGTYTYVYGLDLISMTDGSGNQKYLSYDGLGSVTDITNGSGTVTDTFVYDVFGAVTSRTGSTSTMWKFTGEQADDATGDSGYYYLRARHYDPATGRFIGKDKVEFAQRYAYALNNPVLYADRDGECPICKKAVNAVGDAARDTAERFKDPGVWKPVAGAALIVAVDVPGLLINYSCLQTMGITCKVAEIYDLAVMLPATDLGVCLIKGSPLVVQYDFCSHDAEPAAKRVEMSLLSAKAPYPSSPAKWQGLSKE